MLKNGIAVAIDQYIGLFCIIQKEANLLVYCGYKCFILGKTL